MIRELRFSKNVGDVYAFTTERGTADALNPYSEFNCCSYTGDSDEHVEKCRTLLCRELRIAPPDLITARQRHTTEVATIDDAFLQKPDMEKAHLLDGVDGLVTNEKNKAIGVFTADCVPIILFDPEAKVVAAVHAGWKGTLHNIVANAIDKMAELGSSPTNMLATFGPSICQKCFEVGDDVASLFAEGMPTLQGIMIYDIRRSKHLIDLVAANSVWMRAAGIRAENIAVPGFCTKCNPETYFSARLLGINSGRLLTGIVLRND